MEELKLSLSVDEINIVLKSLDEQPHKIVAGIIQKIQAQGKSQLLALEEANKVAKTENIEKTLPGKN